jgi:hypothetical protein
MSAKKHAKILTATTNQRSMLELISADKPKPIGLPQSHVPFKFRFHHVFLFPTA